MRQDQIIKVLKKLGSPKNKVHHNGVTANCPLYWKHEKGTDARPSLFVFTSNNRSSVSNAICHSCGFRGTVEDLVWEVKRATQKEGMMNLLEYVERAEMGETELEELGDSIPDYEDVPNYVKTNSKLQSVVKKKKVIQSQWLIPPDGSPIQTLDYGDMIPLKQNDINRMIKPFLGDIPDYWYSRGFTREDAHIWDIGTQKRFYYRKIKGQKEYFMDFGDRLLIPIKDFNNNFVGWSARALTDSDAMQTYQHKSGLPIYRMAGSPKYMHCPNFNRNNYLYGEHLINRSNKTAFICEGFFDAVNLKRNGIQNPLAIMGTAIGVNQVKKLRQFFDRLVIFFDGDKAGIEAGLKAKDQLKDQFKVHVINPELYLGKDPGDMTKQEIDDAMADSF